MERVDAQEVAGLLRERADVMEFLAGDSFEIKLVARFAPVTGGDRVIEHIITRTDALFDLDADATIFELMRKRLSLIDRRLLELGVRIAIASADEN